MFTSHRGVDTAKFRDCPYPMDSLETIEVSNNLPLGRIEDDQLVGIHMRDVEASAACVQTLIIKPDCGSGHGDVGDLC